MKNYNFCVEEQLYFKEGEETMQIYKFYLFLIVFFMINFAVKKVD